MTRPLRALIFGIGLMFSSIGAAEEETSQPPGLEALEAFRNGQSPQNPVRNRFFLKSNRFEIAPAVGIVPNNPFARRVTPSLSFGYHFTETLSVQGMFGFAPDAKEGDLKSLTAVLVERAGETEFRQPLDKVTLSAAFGISWAPLYGKINVLGETVLNFDVYGFLGMGMVLQSEYYADRDPEGTNASTSSFLRLGGDSGAPEQTEVRPAPVIGLGGNFFITQSVAIKIDGKFFLFPDDKPIYNPNDPPQGLRLGNRFLASVGVSIFFPRMKPRLYDF
ncbi:MAG: outer membrane beta-barrel domain-containing protein [Myxococcota bacterium]